MKLSLTESLGFTREPFDKHLPAKDLFLSSQIKVLSDKLKFFLKRRGVAVITGEIGSGKSTAIRAFTEKLEKNLYDIVYICEPTIGFKGILSQIALQLKLEACHFKWKLVERLKTYIEKNATEYNKITLIVIDEAQLLEPKTLEELRLFTNFQFDSLSPMNLMLVAQPDMWHTIRLNSLKALYQRINFRYHIYGLDKSEIKEYIKHHIKIAGRTDDLFTDDVINDIFQQAKGIPRIINNLCYECLIDICQENKNIVDSVTLEKVLVNLDMN